MMNWQPTHAQISLLEKGPLATRVLKPLNSPGTFGPPLNNGKCAVKRGIIVALSSKKKSAQRIYFQVFIKHQVSAISPGKK